MKKLLTVVMACYGLNAGAQVHESKNFVYLYSDSVIYAKNIRLRPDLLGSLQLRADSRRIPLQQVKFFNNDNGFFANTTKQNFARVKTISERVIEGRINLFQEVSYEPFLYDRGYMSNRGYMSGGMRGGVNGRMFYNKGYGDLKKVNYNNLKADMADRAESADLLESYRKSMRTSKVLYAAAGASFVAGVVSFLVSVADGSRVSENKGVNGMSYSSIKDSNFTSSFVFLGLGLGFVVGGVTVNVSGLRHLEGAVDTYNR